MSKTILSKTGLIILIGFILTILFSGCVENKVSAAEEINISASLINNAELKLESGVSGFSSGAYTGSKIELNVSRVDFEEALKVLNNTSSDYEEENKEIEKLKIFAETGLYRVDCSENLINALEH